jgi:hypothetical protein
MVAVWRRAGYRMPFDWDGASEALSALGRTHARIPHFAGSMVFLPRYDGRQWNGHFDGATPVTHQVCAWLKEEVERLFRALPGSDGSF